MEDPLKVEKFKLDQMEFRENTRQRNIDNVFQQAGLNLARQRENRQATKDKADKETAMGASYTPLFFGSAGKPYVTGSGQPLLIGGKEARFNEVADPKAQAVALSFVGKPLTKTVTPYDKVLKKTGKAITNPVTDATTGSPIYEVKTDRLLSAVDPTKAFKIIGGKANVYNIDTSRPIKLPVYSPKGSLDGYSTWYEGRTRTKDGIEHQVLAPSTVSPSAMAEFDSQYMLGAKKENQRVMNATQAGQQEESATDIPDFF